MSTSTSIILRPATLDDFAAIAAIDALATGITGREELLRRSLAGGQCIIAEYESDPAGFIIQNNEFFGFGFIPLIVVAPSYRRRGIALSLIAAAQQQCKSSKLFSSTNTLNHAARCLFERAGFLQSGLIENLDVNDSEIIFFKSIQSTTDQVT